MNFENFQIQKWMLQNVRAEKVDKKDWVISLVSIFPSWVMVLKLSKKVHFLQSKKSRSTKAIYIYASERSCYTLSERGIVYYVLTFCLRDIRVWCRQILSNFCWVSIYFGILIASVSSTVAQTLINQIVFERVSWELSDAYM